MQLTGCMKPTEGPKSESGSGSGEDQTPARLGSHHDIQGEGTETHPRAQDIDSRSPPERKTAHSREKQNLNQQKGDQPKSTKENRK